MYTDIRKRMLATIGLVLAVIILLIVAYLLSRNTVDEEQTTPTETPIPAFTESSNTTPDQFIVVPPLKESTELKDPDALFAKQTARTFVERFASYSNQNDNVNIDNVLPMTTASMGAWIATQTKELSKEFEGAISTVVASSILSYSSEKAEVRVDVQQALEMKAEKSTIQKSGRVVLVKSGSEWKVDGFYWE